ncbi:hypothetical protein SERLA73DRAFT_166516 [Serpula lacrymans var. lacrymans S7.3]|uniref:RING-type domain-containing protein n=2 Tax=Serpula lacrymans var. lacrymans TaxID=341189 RepID=F8PPD0_SERL3|nr:uncharacterized protein SERLADRAFT_446870 [Serpula lacrymans var. lacrymans S7.9]EGO02007.1 hypothetical protein SERLA73DRAFT_166516 [Serpula lacrymans var. lacrymans S7.3]EGO27631.1 hypothetical protein SERLADRAFT_446870 [Serpula lacrymans var. lacrymans S7.9]
MIRHATTKKTGILQTRHDRSSSSLSSLSPVPSDTPPVKKSKRAETRKCPVCGEIIAVRLLGKHSELESQRVDEIIRNVGSTEVLADDPQEGSSSGSRRSAVKARKSLSAMNPRFDSTNSLEVTVKTIQTITRHRKQRHAKLKEMAREDELPVDQDDYDGETTCPVCLQMVRGDRDVIEAHVDACLAHENARQQEEEDEDEIDVDGEGTLRVTDGANLRGMGFHVRNEQDQDVDDEVDVDGDDEAVFGNAQFTEGDILGPTSDPHADADDGTEGDVDIEDGPSDDRQRQTLRDLVADGKFVRRSSPSEGMEIAKAKLEEVIGVGDTDKLDLAIEAARTQGNGNSLILALENKVKQLESMRVSSSTSLLCRICLDPYTEPTVSTGCWHTCCRECWLRCLGSTKLCPICKRITAAIDLRRVYL